MPDWDGPGAEPPAADVVVGLAVGVPGTPTQT
jgi:hypothetical protein